MSGPLPASLGASDRAAACRQLSQQSPSPRLLQALTDALADPDPGVSRAASDALVSHAERTHANAGSDVREPIHRLLRHSLDGDSARLRWAAAFSLWRLGAPVPELVPSALEAARSQDRDLRWAAGRLLVDAGQRDEGARAAVIELARPRETPAVRRVAIFAIRDLGPDRPDARAALLLALHADDVTVKRAALAALGRSIREPAVVIARLSDVLASDRDRASRTLAAVALGNMGSACPGAIPSAVLRQLEQAAQVRAGPACEGSQGDGLRRAAAGAVERLRGSDPNDS